MTEVAAVVGLDDQAGPRPRVVLVDVRAERRAVMRTMIEVALGAGTVVAQVPSASEAVEAVDRFEADAVVVEIQLPLDQGLLAIATLRASHPSLTIAVCTFHRDLVIEQQASAAGADVYLVKPVSARELRSALESARGAPLAVAAAV